MSCISFSKILAFCCLSFSAILCSNANAATITNRGIYVILDIYQGPAGAPPQGTDLFLLQQAASTSCGSPGSPFNTIFCRSTSGILLDVYWCEWEPDSVSTSCGTGVQQDGTTKVKFGEATTACHTQTYDSCQQPTSPLSACSVPQMQGTTGNSTLGTALYNICEVNLKRLAAGLNPLKMSVGLDAGVYTPASVITAAYHIDEPGILKGGNNFICGRQPLVWGTGYVAAYEAALSALITYIAQFDAPYVDGQNVMHNTTSPITIIKVTGLEENTLETAQHGDDTFPANANGRQNFTAPNPSSLPNCTYVKQHPDSAADAGTTLAESL